MTVKWKGSLVDDLLQSSAAISVHSQFANGVNLKIGEELIFVGDDQKGCVPFGIHLSQKDYQRLTQQPNWQNSIEKSATGLRFKYIDVVLDDCPVYDNYWGIGKVKLTELTLAISQLFEQSIGETGLDFTGLISSRPFELPAKEQSQAFLFHYIGRGLGLTPAGDDFTIGLLAVDCLSGFLPKDFRQVLKGILAEKRTTDVSESYLRSAVDGYFSSAVINVMMNIDKLAGENESEGEVKETINTWDKAIKALPEATVALISIPGAYVALEIEKALDNGLHAFVFSDNVPLEEEARLKQKAHEKGLLVMGPDCGTGVIHSLPLAFTNNVRQGAIGVVGASGTGIQEVTTLIHRYGQGVTNAIGTGGRDLSTEVGATTMIDSIVALNQEADTEVIVVISKPPAKEVATKVLDVLRKVEKPVVTLFLGSKPLSHEEGLYHAYTLEEAAQLATKIANHEEVIYTPAAPKDVKQVSAKGLKGLYSGGTLAYEAAFLIQDALNLTDNSHQEGFIMQVGDHEIMDLGDDIYTNGRPHPMIDPEVRVTELNKVLEQPAVGVVMFDVVLGYGAHDDMATSLAGPVQELQEKLKVQGRDVVFVAVIVGTDADKQGYGAQVEILEEAGVIVCQNNVQMIQTALAATGHSLSFATKEVTGKVASPLAELPTASEKVIDLLTAKPKVINIGLQSFTESITDNGGEVVHFDWRPSAGGDVKLQKTLYFLNNYRFTSKEEN